MGNRMGARIHFTPQLKDWILHNIDRGIPPTPLVSNMVEQGFDPQIAGPLVRTVWSARATGAPIPDGAIETDQIDAAAYRHEPSRLSASNTIATDDRNIRVALRLAQPVAAVLDNVLSPGECDQLIALAAERLRPSTIVDPGTGMDIASTSRSSEGMFFRLAENPLVARIDRRVSQLMNLPLENGEGLQILRYRSGAQSMPHFDFLMPTNAASVASLERSGQRVSTLVIYLNDVAQGGETVFPEIGLAVTPRKGSAVYFEYCNSAGQLDALSLHAASSVRAGEKWVATKWMRQRRFVPGG
jgi:prolyl 4-hydroxylase